MEIIISGFGRSGTTWLSDIVSKCLGGIILFEPFHPCVFDKSEEFIYSTSFETDVLKSHLLKIAEHTPQNAWLLRNHLNAPLESHAKEFIEYIWQNSKVFGYKSIRGNHFLRELTGLSGDSKLIHIYRHPLAVLSSINNRPRFWEEIGWEKHLKFFYERTLFSSWLNASILSDINSIKETLKTKNEHIILMWSISFLIAVRDVWDLEGFLICYEDLYKDPYRETQSLMSYISQESMGLHPSYFFTPSMTSLGTIHHLRKYYNESGGLDEIFWKNHLKQDEAYRLKTIVKEVLSLDNQIFKLAEAKGYVT